MTKQREIYLRTSSIVLRWSLMCAGIKSTPVVDARVRVRTDKLLPLILPAHGLQGLGKGRRDGRRRQRKREGEKEERRRREGEGTREGGEGREVEGGI